MTNTVTINNATINSDDLAGFIQRSRTILAEIDVEKDAFKNLVQEAADQTKLPKRIVSKFLKARFNAKTKDIVAEAETLDALCKAVDE